VRALVALLLCVCASVASARSDEVEEVVIDIPYTVIPSEGLDLDVNVPQFDTQGGTRWLLGVDFDLSIDFSGTMGIENLDPERSTTFELALLWALELWDPDPDEPDLLIDLEAQRVIRGLLDPFDGEIDFGGFSGATFDVAVNDVAGAGTVTDPEDFSLYEGTGTVALPLAASYLGTAEAGNTDEFVAEFWDVAFEGTLTVRYTFPEPTLAGWVLLAAVVLRERSTRRAVG